MDRLGRRGILNDDDDDDGSGRYPYGWFVIPVVGAIALACVVMLLRYRRRKLVRTLTSYRNNALRQDIETMGPPRHHRPWNLARTGVSAGQNGGVAAGPGPGHGPVANRRNEGLNEFGEAPPAYTAQKQQSAVEEIELGHMGSSQVNVALPPAVATTTSATTTSEHGSPPSYIEAQQTTVGSSPNSINSPHGGPDRPPPVVLGSR
ncbi:hypothetical protein UCREL1_9971 [Eutypa lata UCREL1]|uniref:Uncharacterized protein n=1 Tax=Eutypa lata (strain UCR-EL1) TaxID=1287681 RepID=M7SZT6_EUTLA|nr:hypothetical protein UCREL1_9971 [Eutypa lata UCREL1]